MAAAEQLPADVATLAGCTEDPALAWVLPLGLVLGLLLSVLWPMGFAG